MLNNNYDSKRNFTQKLIQFFKREEQLNYIKISEIQERQETLVIFNKRISSDKVATYNIIQRNDIPSLVFQS